ncbi:MAG: prolyl-tRNA synthetase [Chloroflexota bacterium]|jgi:prolyl-tRNA synthetase|nr:prolyl-tRNA synthetase [Chloroflexota bacterium]
MGSFAHAEGRRYNRGREVTVPDQITDLTDDYSRWYNDVIEKAELADHSPVRGCMVVRPYGYALWENMQAALDARIKATGHLNAYFPLFIPESLLQAEAEHVAGFNPEVAWVTRGGQEELHERLAVRPTSEAIILSMYGKWVQSWRDLPILINQWANVVRWEKRTYYFLRTTEFLWQEGHTAHRTEPEAMEEVLRMLDVYRDFAETELAMPVIPGRKSEAEKFAGAASTFTVEAMMGDGKALQAGTSHFFGQQFAKAFNIDFLDVDGERRHAWTTSWGASTRLVGGLIMTHGDDNGLKLPPRVAPYQVVIVPIFRSDDDRVRVAEAVDRISAALRGRIRSHVDWSDKTPGWKFNEWEMKGAPLRLEVGPRDVVQGQVVAVRRHSRSKEPIPMEGVADRLSALLDEIQREMFATALAFREAHTHHVGSIDDIAGRIDEERGFYWAPWCGSAACEEGVRARTGATLRCIPLEGGDQTGPCVACGGIAAQTAVFARSY